LDSSEVTQVQLHGSLQVTLGLVRPAFEYYASSDQLQLRQTVKLKCDFTCLLHVDQHPDYIVVRPTARASHGVTATLYAPIHSSYSFDNSKVGDRRTVYELNGVRFG
jgi:hypothetical protein